MEKINRKVIFLLQNQIQKTILQEVLKVETLLYKILFKL